MREPRPVTRAELSEKNKTLRVIAAIALLIIGAVGITAGFMSLLSKETGWQNVQITTQERNCSENFVFQYHFSGSGAEATAVNSKLQTVYGDACVKAYQLFTPDEEIAGVNNIYYVNHNPNTEITVDPILYEAFEKLVGTPWLYLGPVYNHYYNLILNTEESLVEELDPLVSSQAAAYVGKLAEFAADRDAVFLELLGNNRVKLHVSQEYLTFAEAEEVDTFLDFAYLTNAFVIDYMAETLIAQGLTEGYLASVDGYTRNLTGRETFSFNIVDRVGDTVYPAGVMNYRGPVSMVFLKDYALAAFDTFYRGSGNHIVHLFADPLDGIYRTSRRNLVSYSYETGCADVLLKMLPSFVGRNTALPEGVYSVWCEDGLICYNDDAVSFGTLLRNEEISYRAVLKN